MDLESHFQCVKLFRSWLTEYGSILETFSRPTVIIDNTIADFLELVAEFDAMCQEFAVELDIKSVGPYALTDGIEEYVLCITPPGSYLATLGQMRILRTTRLELGQVWEVRAK